MQGFKQNTFNALIQATDYNVDRILYTYLIQKAIDEERVIVKHPNIIKLISADLDKHMCIAITNDDHFNTTDPLMVFHVEEIKRDGRTILTDKVTLEVQDGRVHVLIPRQDNSAVIEQAVLKQVYSSYRYPQDVDRALRSIIKTRTIGGHIEPPLLTDQCTFDFRVLAVEGNGDVRIGLINDKYTFENIAKEYYIRVESKPLPSYVSKANYIPLDKHPLDVDYVVLVPKVEEDSFNQQFKHQKELIEQLKSQEK